MNLKEKLLEQYYNGTLNEQKITSLRRFIAMTGRDYTKMTPKQIDKISNTSAYKQFRKLRSMLRMQQKSESLKRKIQNEDLITEYKRAAEIGTLQRRSHLDVGEYHKQQVHAKKGQKQKILKQKILNVSSSQPVDIHMHPGQYLYRSLGPRGFLATKKGRTILKGVSKSGKTDHLVKSYYETVQEEKIDQKVETPELKTKYETKPFSNKMERLIQKNREINLKKGDKVVINPSLNITTRVLF